MGAEAEKPPVLFPIVEVGERLLVPVQVRKETRDVILYGMEVDLG